MVNKKIRGEIMSNKIDIFPPNIIKISDGSTSIYLRQEKTMSEKIAYLDNELLILEKQLGIK